MLLLTGLEVVPNDIVLNARQALIISGPNAGGKTVALKTAGLIAWMVRSGLPVPARADSIVGWFDRVLCDIGDEQSIVHSLSTFSAHIVNLCSILECASPSCLVLLDEIAAGTDPEEGAALAAAVLEALTLRGAAVGVTTHYERLKELATQNERFANASVGFDFEQMAPTFRLHLGVPGPSSALAVASRHGLPSAVIARAKALLPTQALDRETALRELSRERAELGSRTQRRRARSARGARAARGAWRPSATPFASKPRARRIATCATCASRCAAPGKSWTTRAPAFAAARGAEPSALRELERGREPGRRSRRARRRVRSAGDRALRNRRHSSYRRAICASGKPSDIGRSERRARSSSCARETKCG